MLKFRDTPATSRTEVLQSPDVGGCDAHACSNLDVNLHYRSSMHSSQPPTSPAHTHGSASSSPSYTTSDFYALYMFSFAHFSPFSILPLRSFKHTSSKLCSYSVILPTGWMVSTPFGPSSTLEAKYVTPWSL